MKKKKITSGLLLGFCVFWPCIGSAAPVDLSTLLSPARVLNGLPDALADFYPAFQIIAFVLLCIGLMTSMVSANSMQDNLRAIVKSCFLAGAIALTPVLSMQISSAASGMATKFDSSGIKTAGKIITTSRSYQDYMFEAKKAPTSTLEAVAEAKNAAWWQVPAIYLKGVFKDTVQATVALLNLVKTLPELLTRVVLVLLFMLAMFVGWIVQYIVGMIQFFILNASLILMPVFIAGLNTTFFRSQSSNFISFWIGVACWPIGWGLWNIGTIAICDVMVDFISSLATLSAPAAAAEGSLIGMGATAGLAVSGEFVLMVLLALALMFVVWVVAGAFIAPILIAKAVTSGANLFSGAVTSGLGAGLAVMGTVLKVGGSIAGPGVGSTVAGAAGSVMQTMSKGSVEHGVDFGAVASSIVPSMKGSAGSGGQGGSRSETARTKASRVALRDVLGA